MTRYLCRLLLLWLVAVMPGTKAASNPVVVIRTSLGDIRLELYADRAPQTVANFLAYVEKDGYRESIFHRVIPGFMVQGGGHYPDMTLLEELQPVANEADRTPSNLAGTIAMAREDAIDSATRQFFINTVDNTRLDHTPQSCTREDEARIQAAAERGLYRPQTCQSFGYTVFGHVVQGMDVVQKIEAVETRSIAEYDDVPVAPVFIKVIELEANGATPGD